MNVRLLTPTHVCLTKGNQTQIMKYPKLFRLLSITLLVAMLLAGCQDITPPAETTGVGDTTPATEPVTLPVTAPVITPDTPTETEPETELPLADIVTHPETTLPDLSTLLEGTDNSIRLAYDFAGASLAAMKADVGLNFVSQTDFAATDKGFVSDKSAWRSIGLSQLIPAKPYTVEAELTVTGAAGNAYTHTGMVGLHCQTSGHLFIDSGVWFCFRGSKMTITVMGENTITFADQAFSADDGITFRAEEADGVADIYVNDTLICKLTFGDELTVTDADGTKLGTMAADKLSDMKTGCGFFRTMSHFADTTIRSMKLTVEDKTAYTPADTIYALRDGLPYAFGDLAAYTSDGGVAVRDGILFADSSIVADMFGFAHTADGDKRTLTRPGVTLTMTADADRLSVNEDIVPFTTTYAKDSAVMVDVKSLAATLGYGYTYDEAGQTHYLAADTAKLTEEKKQAMTNRFDLYRDVVYNYEDVECDSTVDKRYEPTPYEDRLVGIAYSTWQYPTTSWGVNTWGTPLGGGYVSTDPEAVYRHGIQLRDAGVDFVFVDWSNNTGYDPATMSHMMDFRTIETATDVLFEVWSKISDAPKICLFLGPGHSGIESVKNGNHQKKADQVWKNYVEKYPELYFTYEGKPLIICYGATPTQYGTNPIRVWEDDRYTIRWMTGYVGQQPLFEEKTLRAPYYWSWEERGTQTYTTTNDKRIETMTVSAATRPQGAEGTDGYIPASPRNNGATFKRQFQRAINLGAGMVLITTWNEWHSGEQPNPEGSRDIEPSEEYGTFYYDLMREQIRKYKGLISADEIPARKAE